MKLSLRLTLVLTLLGLVAIAGVAWLSWIASAGQIRIAIDESLVETAHAILTFAEGDLGSEMRRNPSDDTPRTQVAVGADGGALLVLNTGRFLGNDPVGITPELIERALGDDEWYDTLDVRDRTFRILAAPLPDLPVGQSEGTTLSGAIVYEDVTSEWQAIADLRTRLAFIALAAIATMALGSWFVGRWLARPLVGLTAAVEQVAEHDATPARIEVDRSDEIGRLAQQFNRMLSALEVGREQQQRLVADASHELRTPLTALRMRTEFMHSFDTLTPEQRSIVEGAVVDVGQLSALVADLVDLASQTHSPDEAAEHVELAAIVGSTVERSAIASGRNITLDADRSAAVVYPGMIRRAVQNLIDNAVKYSIDGEPVAVRIESGRIEVTDGGPGIPPEDLDFVFDRFFRSPKARNRPGNGIGLAIVDRVAETHGGQVFATNNPDRGARVGFSVVGVGATPASG